MGSWGKSSEEILQQQFPLHRACRDGDVQTVAALLGDVNELGPSNGLFQEDTFYGWTPTHWAAYFGKLSCLVRLIEHGEVSCNITTYRFHQSPLHIAAFGGHGHCLQWLLHRGAQINLQDYLGETSLHKAARTGSMECVSLLVAQGAILGTKNYNRQTASQLAVTCGFPECANYLERAQELKDQPRAIYQDLLPPGPLAPAVGGKENHSLQVSTDPQQLAVISNGLNGGAIPPTFTNGSTNGVSQSVNNDEDAMDTDDAMMTEDTAEGMSCFTGAGEKGDGISNGDVLLQNGVVHNHVPVAGRKRGREDLDVECLKRIRRGEADRETLTLFSVDGVEAVTVLPPKFVNPNRDLQIPAVPLPFPPDVPQTALLGPSHDSVQVNQKMNVYSCGQLNGFHDNNHPSNRFHGNNPDHGFHHNQETSNGFHGNPSDSEQSNGFHHNRETSNGFNGVTTSALEHRSTVNMQQGYDSLVVESLVNRPL